MHNDSYDVAENKKYLIGIATLHFASTESRRRRRILANQLLDTGLFNHLTESQLARLTKAARAFAYPPHWTVLAAGTVPDTAPVVLGGSVSCRVGGRVVTVIGPADIVGLREALAQRPAGMSVISEVPLRG